MCTSNEEGVQTVFECWLFFVLCSTHYSYFFIYFVEMNMKPHDPECGSSKTIVIHSGNITGDIHFRRSLSNNETELN